MSDPDILFQPLTLGAIQLSNRIVMAPLTRARATDHVPNALMAEYYTQRASAGLIVTEATAISEQGYGWHGAPGIYNESQVEGWKNVTDAVHAADGRIVLQLWHMGRVSHPSFQGGRAPVGPSAISATGDAHTPTGKRPYVIPHPLTGEEISAIVSDYAAATVRARQSGFDGVEIHGANGYLIDQFLRDSANRRTDEYGGTIENRLRLMVEVVQVVTIAWSSERTGIRLSPTMNGNGMSDSDPVRLYSSAAKVLSDFKLAYLHIAEAIRPGRLYNPDAPRVTPHIRSSYNGKIIVNGGYDQHTAAEAIGSGSADATAFGQPFLANPDLVQRFKSHLSLAPVPDSSVWYNADGARGYTDFPVAGDH